MFIRVHKHYTTESGVQGPAYLINTNDIQQIIPTFSGSMIRYHGRIFHAVESYDTLMAKLIFSPRSNFIEVLDWIKMDAAGQHTPVLINAEHIVSIRLSENDSPTTLTFFDEMGEVTLHVEESSTQRIINLLNRVTEII